MSLKNKEKNSEIKSNFEIPLRNVKIKMILAMLIDKTKVILEMLIDKTEAMFQLAENLFEINCFREHDC